MNLTPYYNKKCICLFHFMYMICFEINIPELKKKTKKNDSDPYLKFTDHYF